MGGRVMAKGRTRRTCKKMPAAKAVQLTIGKTKQESLWTFSVLFVKQAPATGLVKKAAGLAALLSQLLLLQMGKPPDTIPQPMGKSRSRRRTSDAPLRRSNSNSSCSV